MKYIKNKILYKAFVLIKLECQAGSNWGSLRGWCGNDITDCSDLWFIAKYDLPSVCDLSSLLAT